MVQRLLTAVVVEVSIDYCSFGWSYNSCQLFQCSFFDTLDGLKCSEEFVARLRTDALDVVQLRLQGVLGALVTVERNGESVHFILQLG